MPPTLLLLARTPRLGTVKSRLAATLGAEAALSLHIAFLRDTAERMTRVARAAGAHLAAAWTEPEGLPAELHSGFAAFSHHVQPQGALGARLLAAQRLAHEAHPGPIVALGGDSPTLPDALLIGACAALASADVVIAPALDGGYVLLGVRQPYPELTHDIPWGSSEVAARTRAAAARAGLSCVELEAWYDVDDDDGFRRLARDVASGRAPDSRWTARALASLAAVTGATHD